MHTTSLDLGPDTAFVYVETLDMMITNSRDTDAKTGTHLQGHAV